MTRHLRPMPTVRPVRSRRRPCRARMADPTGHHRELWLSAVTPRVPIRLTPRTQRLPMGRPRTSRWSRRPKTARLRPQPVREPTRPTSRPNPRADRDSTPWPDRSGRLAGRSRPLWHDVSRRSSARHPGSTTASAVARCSVPWPGAQSPSRPSTTSMPPPTKKAWAAARSSGVRRWLLWWRCGVGSGAGARPR